MFMEVLTIIGVCRCVSVNELMETLGHKGDKVMFHIMLHKIKYFYLCVSVHKGNIPFSLSI